MLIFHYIFKYAKLMFSNLELTVSLHVCLHVRTVRSLTVSLHVRTVRSRFRRRWRLLDSLYTRFEWS